MKDIIFEFYGWVSEDSEYEVDLPEEMIRGGYWTPVYRKVYVGDPKDYGKEETL